MISRTSISVPPFRSAKRRRETKPQPAFPGGLRRGGLDAERARLYFDLVMHSLSEAARRAFEAMDPAKYEYQSEFAKQYYGQGRAEGIAEGKAEGKAEGLVEGAIAGRTEVVLRLLTLRFGVQSELVRARIRNTSAEELDGIAERLLTAATLEEALRGR